MSKREATHMHLIYWLYPMERFQSAFNILVVSDVIYPDLVGWDFPGILPIYIYIPYRPCMEPCVEPCPPPCVEARSLLSRPRPPKPLFTLSGCGPGHRCTSDGHSICTLHTLAQCGMIDGSIFGFFFRNQHFVP